ncbi:DUF1653 domain-containing protein [Butyrivibrio sp. CB08]|uniref:DUF1653 domain-containing protein n=1 Tax=Butyrivibrio sp. CB08 TaxID=2364879 RepID=UPI000EAAC6E5|nr:DUF1653 domain-containing protein [Butyrivibrio sp. CB08]RKM62263.1 DUF1653 domain-containing protein [Butyrivibrio sp. CB08]
MADRPRPQEIYRHFKGNMYQVLTIAIHSETMEEMVVYQALYGDYKVYVRPLQMFMSEVDRNKYPDVKQKMRFEKVTPSAERIDERVVTPAPCATVRTEAPSSGKPVRLELDESSLKKDYSESSAVMSKTVDEEASELNLDPLVIQFMDADLAVDKGEILSKLRPIITNDMIDIMALSVGVVINEGDVYDRYNDLRNCLATMEKYESTRLRS